MMFGNQRDPSIGPASPGEPPVEDSAQAARAPGQAAARATRAAGTGHANDEAAERETAAPATSAAHRASPAAPATMDATTAVAAATTVATAAAMAAATATTGQLHAAANVFPIKEVERGETDVGHFLFAKDQALIGRGIVGLRQSGTRHAGCGGAACQRKTQSGGTQRTHGGGFGRAFWHRSLLVSWHGCTLQEFLLDVPACARQIPGASLTWAAKCKISRRVGGATIPTKSILW